jgi:hypothetical protein
MIGESKVNVPFDVPATAATMTLVVTPMPSPAGAEHLTVVTVVHDVDMHMLEPNRADAVMSTYAPKLKPWSVTEVPAQPGMFSALV